VERKFVLTPEASAQVSSRQHIKFTKEEEDYFFSLPTSIEKYIQYYKRHWDYLDGEFKSVGDFCNKMAVADEEYLCYLRDKLSEHFDVKITLIFRDPVRKIWSEARTQYSRMYNKKGGIRRSSLYGEVYEKYARVFGEERVLPMVMERIWEVPSELSDFLGHPIPKMHRNAYYPERGTNIKEFPEFWDQWRNEKNPIDYDRLRREFDLCYQDYKRVFGDIPVEWGKKDIDIL
tara:strand:- start:1963 stop:2658 length:696 start_codon:yes stop_codon:yes gene_type:complete